MGEGIPGGLDKALFGHLVRKDFDHAFYPVGHDGDGRRYRVDKVEVLSQVAQNAVDLPLGPPCDVVGQGPADAASRQCQRKLVEVDVIAMHVAVGCVHVPQGFSEALEVIDTTLLGDAYVPGRHPLGALGGKHGVMVRAQELCARIAGIGPVGDVLGVLAELIDGALGQFESEVAAEGSGIYGRLREERGVEQRRQVEEAVQCRDERGVEVDDARLLGGGEALHLGGEAIGRRTQDGAQGETDDEAQVESSAKLPAPGPPDVLDDAGHRGLGLGTSPAARRGGAEVLETVHVWEGQQPSSCFSRWPLERDRPRGAGSLSGGWAPSWGGRLGSGFGV